jgi:hypothetical protein
VINFKIIKARKPTWSFGIDYEIHLNERVKSELLDDIKCTKGVNSIINEGQGYIIIVNIADLFEPLIVIKDIIKKMVFYFKQDLWDIEHHITYESKYDIIESGSHYGHEVKNKMDYLKLT